MSYKSLTNIYNDLKFAVDSVSGLGELFMIDESEINKINTVEAPICIVEIPNSSISNINKAWEEYDINFFVLTNEAKNISDYGELGAYYDTCMDKFSSFTASLLKQRNGDYVIDRESFEIERLSNFSNHLLSGVKVNFTLLAPSYLGYYSATSLSTLSYTTNLYAFFNGYKNVVRTDSSLSWTSDLHSGTPKQIVHNDANNIITQTVPRFNFLSPVGNSTEGFRIPSFTLSGNDFSFFFKMSVAAGVESDTRTLFTITDPSNGNGVILGITTTGNPNQAHIDGQPYIQVDEDGVGGVSDVRANTQVSFTDVDLEPLSETVIAVVNDSSNNKCFIHIRNTSTSKTTSFVSEAVNATFDDAELLIGTDEIHQWDYSYRGFVGTMSHIAIYDAALTDDTVIQSVMNQVYDI